MAGFFRNILTVLAALFKYGAASPLASVTSRFRITPLDTGISKLKSDKFLHLVESAQIDFFIRTGLMGIFIRRGYSFVNVSQIIRFSKPVKVFSGVEIVSRIIYWDERIAYFEHLFLVRGDRCACVLVKTKFKQGSKTIEPAGVIGTCSQDKPQYLNDWDNLINAL